MPFTFAHPAIVLPLRHSRHFHFPACIIGSMAPDFEYFFRLQAYSTYSHTIFGVLYFDLPLVIVLWLLYAHIVERPLRHCLPAWMGNRFGRERTKRAKDMPGIWRSSLVFVYSALFGVCSHLIWDAFTHKGAYAVSRLPFLQQHLSLGGMELPVYKVLQHGSTCIGLAVIAFAIWKSGWGEPAHHTASGIPLWVKGLYWMGIGAGGAVVACLYLIANKSSLTPSTLLAGVVPFLSGSIMSLIVFSWLFGRFGLKK